MQNTEGKNNSALIVLRHPLKITCSIIRSLNLLLLKLLLFYLPTAGRIMNNKFHARTCIMNV